MATSASPRGKSVDALTMEEGSFGVAASGNWQKTLIYGHSLEEKQPFEDDPLLGLPRNNDRDQTAPAPGLPTAAGDITVPLDLAHIGLWLKRLMGAASTSGSSDFVHVFTSGKEVLPHWSFEARLKAGTFMQYVGCLANTLRIEASRAGGYQRCTVGVLFRKENALTASAGGAPVLVGERDPIAASTGAFLLDGTLAADVMSVNAALDNKAKPKDYLGDVYVSGHDLDEEATFGGSIRMRFRSMAMYDLAASGAPIPGEILFAKSSVRRLSLAMPVMRLAKSGLPVPGPGGIEQEFEFRAEQSASVPMLTATLKNAVASY